MSFLHEPIEMLPAKCWLVSWDLIVLSVRPICVKNSVVLSFRPSCVKNSKFVRIMKVSRLSFCWMLTQGNSSIGMGARSSGRTRRARSSPGGQRSWTSYWRSCPQQVRRSWPQGRGEGKVPWNLLCSSFGKLVMMKQSRYLLPFVWILLTSSGPMRRNFGVVFIINQNKLLNMKPYLIKDYHNKDEMISWLFCFRNEIPYTRRDGFLIKTRPSFWRLDVLYEIRRM